DISGGGHRDAEADNPRHSVERSQMLSRDRESVKRGEICRLAPSLHINLGPQPAKKLRAAAFGRKHSAEKKEVPGLYCFRIRAERLRRLRKNDPKFFQSLLGGCRLGGVAVHRNECCLSS